MPTTADVRAQLVDIVVQVLGVDADSVQPDITFKELGADSLTLVEVVEELSRRFDVYLSDDTVDRLRTVQDAVSAVVRSEEGGRRQDTSPALPRTFTSPTYRDGGADRRTPETEVRRDRAQWFGWRMAAIGLTIGGVLGLMFTGLVNASGIADVALPPLPASSTATPTPTSTATPTPQPTATVQAKPTFQLSKNEVEPGERFTLTGRFPELGGDADLQVEVRDPGGEWEDFPVTAKTRGQGEFETQVYTSRTGERELRVTHTASGTSTPTAKVKIG